MKIKKSDNYEYIFGPVPSRRLGRSLGIDLMPHKTCSLNCIYCECGKTTNLTTREKEFVPTEKVKKELETYLKNKSDIDYATFSGSGEPTLHSGISEIIDFLKTGYPMYKIAILTNGTLFYKKNIINNVLNADVIIASLDAASEETFCKINRGHPSLELSKIIEGLVLLRKKFSGDFILEIFVVPNLNDTDIELKKLKEAIAKIAPDKVQINTLDRPGTEPDVKPIDRASFEKIASYLNNAEFVDFDKNKKTRAKEKLDTGKIDVIVATIKRRPCTIEDIMKFTGISRKDTESILKQLGQSGRLEKTKLDRGIFFRALF